MRFATFVTSAEERFGLVLTDPRDGADRVFNPGDVERTADALFRVKGGRSPHMRPCFRRDGAWPRTLAGFLAEGQEGLDAARRMEDFLQRFLEQGDPVALRRAGSPVAAVTLRAPVPRPRLMLGVVGNNAAWIRNDPPRGRNAHQPSCHQRPATAVIGAGETIVVPEGCLPWAGTTELGAIVGVGGRDIARERAMDHVAGFTVVNDCLPSGYARRWGQLDAHLAAQGESAGLPFHFHAANTASWLGKASDGMCPVGPYLVTPEEAGDPYDLMAYYREGGVLRNRAHSGALYCGVEELIHWLSRFMTLEPGMVLHLGAMGQDGIPLDETAEFGPGYTVEAEIERVGVLRNPVALDRGDGRPDSKPSRASRPRPTSGPPIYGGADGAGIASAESWHARGARTFWTLVGNGSDAGQTDRIEPRPYPLAYAAPVSALAEGGDVVVLPAHAGTITAGCELGVVIRDDSLQVSPDAAAHILGYVAVAALRDSSFADGLVAPHVLHANMPAIYARWPDGFNAISGSPVPDTPIAGRAMRIVLEDAGGAVLSEGTGATGDYGLDGPGSVSELSAWITLLPGDVISLGELGARVLLPGAGALPAGARLRAEIEGVGAVAVVLRDLRERGTT